MEKARLEAEPGHIQAVLQFADRAWRRALSATQRKDLVNYYQQLREQDQLSHEEAIQDLIVYGADVAAFLFSNGDGRVRQRATATDE